MNIVADQNIPLLTRTFGRFGSIRRVDGRSLQKQDLEGAEVLLVRSVTRVDRNLLDGTPVCFVGTATIGTDHLDLAWLKSRRIAWTSAPGCNADAAAQYTLAMIMLASRRLERRLRDQRVAIVGRGNVGSRLQRLLRALEVPTMACDPPLQAGGVRGLVSLDKALGADIVSLHVPLTRSGNWPTVAMIDSAAFGRMKPGALLVNTARGGVVEPAALRRALVMGRQHAALDVWPREPEIDAELLAAVTVATPHVAGYSVEGKLRGTRMIFEAFLAWLGESIPAAELDALEEPGTRERVEIAPGEPHAVLQAVLRSCRVEQDDRRLRAAGTLDANGFDALRRRHGPRYEFDHVDVQAPAAVRMNLAELGFQLA